MADPDRRNDKRELITEAAVDVFAEKGFHQARVSDIARRIVSAASVLASSGMDSAIRGTGDRVDLPDFRPSAPCSSFGT